MKYAELLALVVCNVVLFLKMQLVGFATGYYRHKEGTSVESTPLLGKGAKTNLMQRIHRNDLENILAFVLVQLAFFLSGNDKATSIAGIVLYAVFTASRYELE